MTKMDRGITTLYKKLIWDDIARAGHMHRIYTSFFKSADQTNGYTRFKARGPIVVASGHVILRLLVLRGTRSTWHMENFITWDPLR